VGEERDYDKGRTECSPGGLILMTRKTSHKRNGRAKRFALPLPVYFREVDSPIWLEGKTENISCTGVLFHSSSPFAVESTLELRLRVTVAAEVRDPAEIRCKGVVVRLEQRDAPDTPVTLAVAMRDVRLVRQPSLGGNPVGNA
jgi:hypothetical protein